ncbi:iron-siderophore ABC transporter substrate-binding protein [Leifsonia soli]|uniref:Iron complex transport system substrate-binding protein n=1 Tax=Leifsonia soli TaxID=582665 RepID=A0A852T073_9MICO|nr:iron-siderophore ABC transporter substrate-binding protein [Leifsonia soli]NYD74050.1 iron complex transport system substrate-binding protein [Leifsonia soli]
MLPVPRARRRSRLAVIASAIVASAALVLTGCSAGGSAAQSSSSADSGSFPVTVKSALGSATIDEKPKRIATWGWGAQDIVLALGIVPVAMPSFSYGGDSDGVLPWDADRITELGGKTPQIIDADSGEVPFEQFVTAKPDIILAPYSGLTQAEYDTLSKIAPVVAYPDKPWATSWRDQTAIVGKALGMTKETDALVAKTEDSVAALAAKYPVLKDKTFFYAAANEPGKLNVYRAEDPRVQLLNDLGLKNSASIAALDSSKGDGSFFYQLSYENLSKIDTDLLVMYFDKQSSVDAFTSDPLVAAMPTIKDGRFAPIVGESFVAATSAPSVLSIPWMLDRYVPELAKAADKVE